MQVRLFEVPGGWGYDVLNDAGAVMIHQPFRPGASGEQTMSEAEATQRANAILTGPHLACSAYRIKLPDGVTVITMEIGPDDYTGPVQWYENGTLLGEVQTVNRQAILEYTPDAAGTVVIRAGNDTYGWAEAVLEVLP